MGSAEWPHGAGIIHTKIREHLCELRRKKYRNCGKTFSVNARKGVFSFVDQ